MSHISKAKVNVVFNNETLLQKSLLSLKNVTVLQNAFLYRETGTKREIDKSKGLFDYVVQDEKDNTLRVGFKKNGDGVFEVYYDDWGESGRFSHKVINKTSDWYVAYSTAEAIKEAAKEQFIDFNIDVFEDEETEEIVIDAQESIW